MKSLRPSLRVGLSLVVLVASLCAQAPERGTANGNLGDGTMAVEYGVPTWNPAFVGQLKPGAVWRLGNNLPTTCVLTCGLHSASGPITPGEYKLALKYVEDGKVHLLVYQGSSFYNKELPTYEIASKSLTQDETQVKSKLVIGFEGTTMNVGFGPYAASFALQPIKVNPPLETTFANVSAKVSTLALPLADVAMKDLNVGVAEITMGAMKTRYAMHLTMEGEKATLRLKNFDPGCVTTDLATVRGIIEGIKEMMAKNEAMKEQGATFVAMFEKQAAELEAKQKALGRLQGDRSIEATPTKRAAPASVLEFNAERPTGKVVFKFGAKDQDAAFEIVPSEFRVRR